MKSAGEYYLLTPIDDHKSKYKLDNGLELQIEKQLDSNLRTRNPQLGIVKAIPEANPLNLQLGDKVIVRHVVFYGDIAKQRGFTDKPHVFKGGERLYKCAAKDIYFKETDGELPEMLGQFILTEEYTEPDEMVIGDQKIYVGEKKFKDRSRIVKLPAKLTNLKEGSVAITLPNSLYGVNYNKKDYYRIRESEIVGFYSDGEVEPYKEYFLVEDLPEEPNSTLQLPEKFQGYAKQIKSRVIKVHESVSELTVGDIIYRNKGTGVTIDGRSLMSLRDIHFKIGE